MAADEQVASPARPGTPTTSPGRKSRTSVARPAASQVVVERPRALTLTGGAVLPVDAVGTDPARRLELPADVHRAGWWQGGARLGDYFGAIVIAAHVDSFAEGIGPIAEVLEAEPGDVLRLEARHLVQSFAVRSATFVPRDRLADLAATLSFGGDHRLVLITCAGPYDAANGGYRDNVVVVATPTGPVRVR